MNKTAVITDSASDLSIDTIKKYNIKVIPLQIHFSNKTYKDGIEIKPSELYEMLKSEIPKSSLPSHDDIISVFDELKEEGYTDVIYVGISTGLSGTYNFIKMLGQEYEGLNFYSFDTKTLSCAEGMLVSIAAKMIEASYDIKKILDELFKIREKMLALFVVKDLTYLIKGGRINKVTGVIGNILKLCPIIHVNDNGVYEIFSKTLGFSKSLNVMIKEVENRFKGLNVAVTIVYGLEEEMAKTVLERIKKFCTVIEEAISPVTAVLGVHTGPGLVGIIVREAY